FFPSPLVVSGRAFSSSFSCDRADNANTMTKRTAEIWLVMMLLISEKNEGIWNNSRPRTSPRIIGSKFGIGSAGASPYRLIREFFDIDVLEPQTIDVVLNLDKIFGREGISSLPI